MVSILLRQWRMRFLPRLSLGTTDLMAMATSSRQVAQGQPHADRKLASVQRIREIRPIAGADAIEVATVNGWQVVIAKAEGFKVDDMIIYCEIDAFLPICPAFEFLRKSSFKKNGDMEGFRLKTVKLRGQTSQGLILPLRLLTPPHAASADTLPEQAEADASLAPPAVEEGLDVTDVLRICKYEPPVPSHLAGLMKGLFPSFLRKTDAERVQNLARVYATWRDTMAGQFFVTEKMDGSSATYYWRDGVYGVCSRNLDLAEPEDMADNTFWKVGADLMLSGKLGGLGRNVALQGELIGNGIQGNPYNIPGHTLLLFDIFDIDTQKYYALPAFLETAAALGLRTVPLLEQAWTLPATIGDLLLYAEGKSVLRAATDREGVVVRSTDRAISFKAISNTFLLRKKE